MGTDRKRSLSWQATGVAVTVPIFATALALINGVSMSGVDSIANAANVENANAESNPNKREAWMDASDYSASHPGVAFAVNGRTPDASNHQIAEFIKSRFTEKGVDSKYFTSREENMGVSLGFYLNGDAYGPVGLKKMMATVDEVAEHAQALKKLQSGPK